MDVLTSLSVIKTQYESVLETIANLKSEQELLEAEGIDYGTPSYKEGKYLRIVRPAKDGQKREFEYVGADLDKQQKVLEAIGRGKAYDGLGERVQKLDDALVGLRDDLSYLAKRFERAHGLRK